ncbi:aminotransferase class I/II-fold pyridoxal phosphate-dependent enzyme [Pelagibacteraceae bacterium]|nr:aminotransferase class I/II-fold pyridoxal phosphate-dependent enzyme [Pelagibacteraceae bacterium]
MSKSISLSEPYLCGNEKKYIIECFEENWISTNGKFIDKFEKKLSNYLNIDNVLLCMNGTSALDIAIKSLGIKNNEEILVPTITFIAPINAVRYNNCIPVFFDCDKYCNINIKDLINFLEKKTYTKNSFTYNKKSKKKISAIILVHVFGNAVEIEDLISICKKKRIKIIEDASESIGTKYKKGRLKNKFTGTVGDIGCYSFNGNKIITSGAGGAIVSKNNKFIKKARYLINQAKDNSFEYIHNEIGYNLRITNVQAAIGLAQLENINKILTRRKKIRDYYLKFLYNNPNFKMLSSPNYSKNNNWLNIIMFSKKIKLSKIKYICGKLEENKIQVRKIWYPNHLQKKYLKYERVNIKNAIDIQKYSLCLPSSTILGFKEIKMISEIIIKNTD